MQGATPLRQKEHQPLKNAESSGQIWHPHKSSTVAGECKTVNMVRAIEVHSKKKRTSTLLKNGDGMEKQEAAGEVVTQAPGGGNLVT